jgi:hypothetical protein
VSTSQKRDADMDRLLRAALTPASLDSAGECPGPGLLAAFVEGNVTAAEQAALDAHIAGCGRCQDALAALSQDLPEEEADAPATRWFTWVAQPRLRWLVPISAAATIAVVFFATRPLIAPDKVPAAESTRMAWAPATPAQSPAEKSDALREEPVASPKQEEKRSAAANAAGAGLAGQLTGSKDVSESRASAAPAAESVRDKKAAEPAAEMMAARVASDRKPEERAAPAPAPPPAGGQAPVAQQALNAPVAADVARKQEAAGANPAAPAVGAPRKITRNLEAGLVTVSAPGGTVMWRFGSGGRLSRSGDAGASWHDQASTVTADLLAGAAPSPSICWVVGASGTVLLTMDGERWERMRFPVSIDLVAIQASGARTAIVTTSDGRRFETLDAGLTWSPK